MSRAYVVEGNGFSGELTNSGLLICEIESQRFTGGMSTVRRCIFAVRGNHLPGHGYEFSANTVKLDRRTEIDTETM